MDEIREKIRVFEEIFGEEYFLFDIKKEKLRMEQWNKYDISLTDIMETRYLTYIVERNSLEEKRDKYFWEGVKKIPDLKGKNAGKFRRGIIEKLSSEGEMEYADMDNYIKNQKIVLFKMLDVFIIDSQKKLQNKKKGYLFNWENTIFIDFLLDINKEKGDVYRNIMNRGFEDLDDTYIAILYKGIKGLLENNTNSLQFEDLHPSCKCFIKEKGVDYKETIRYQEIKELLSSLEGKILYYVAIKRNMDEVDPVIKEIKLSLEAYNQIMEMLIDKLVFPNITDEEILELMGNTKRYIEEWDINKIKEDS